MLNDTNPGPDELAETRRRCKHINYYLDWSSASVKDKSSLRCIVAKYKNKQKKLQLENLIIYKIVCLRTYTCMLWLISQDLIPSRFYLSSEVVSAQSKALFSRGLCALTWAVHFDLAWPCREKANGVTSTLSRFDMSSPAHEALIAWFTDWLPDCFWSGFEHHTNA